MLVYIDGDKFNCNPLNLLIPEIKKIKTCFQCGKTQVVSPSRYYQSCSCKDSLLTSVQVSLVKSLLASKLVGIAGWFLVPRYSISCIKRGLTHKRIEPMNASQVWRALLKQHNKLVAVGQVTLYNRVTLLRRVYEDPCFLEDMGKEKTSPNEYLDSYVRDTCANFTELLQILKLFPKKKQWENGNLADMRRRMLDTIQTRQKELRGSQNPNGERRLSWKQKYLKLEMKYKSLEASYRQLERDYKELRQSVNRKTA